MFPGFALAVFGRVAGEGDLDAVFFFETDDVFTVLTDQGGMVLVRDLEDLRSLISLAKGSVFLVLMMTLHAKSRHSPFSQPGLGCTF